MTTGLSGHSWRSGQGARLQQSKFRKLLISGIVIITSKKQFRDEFLEYEEVYTGFFYGTLKKEFNRIWDLGKNVIFDIDVIGGLNIKNKYPDQTLSIFLKAPNINDVEKRLIKRNLDSKNILKLRIDKIQEENKLAEKFDISLLNNDLNEAKLKAEKLIMNFIKD